MKKFFSSFLFTATLLSPPNCLASSKSGTDPAPTPPLGWNSFQSYGVYFHDQAAHKNIDAMARLLKPYGYEYFVIDNGWFGEYKLEDGTNFPAEKHASDVNINEYGFFMPSRTYFPNGFRALIKKCHDKGLKFGVHLMRGIPRKAYELNLPIKGTAYRARDIASIRNICTWCPYNYGVDMSKPGAQEWYDGLIQHLADMGIDFIKYDDIVPFPREVEAVTKAIAKCKRPIVLSLSPGDTVPANEKALKVFQDAQMLRVTPDIWDDLHGINLCFEAWKKWGTQSKKNFWIDMDMIPFGKLQLMSNAAKKTADGRNIVRLTGKGTRRTCQLTPAQMRTFITLRALSASPLMVGGDLSTMDDFSLSLLQNKEMLRCNQNGVCATLVLSENGIEIWRAAMRDNPKDGYIGIFNRTKTVTTYVFDTKKLLNFTEVALIDIWNNRKSQGVRLKKLEIAPHDVIFFRFTR